MNTPFSFFVFLFQSYHNNFRSKFKVKKVQILKKLLCSSWIWWKISKWWIWWKSDLMRSKRANVRRNSYNLITSQITMIPGIYLPQRLAAFIKKRMHPCGKRLNIYVENIAFYCDLWNHLGPRWIKKLIAKWILSNFREFQLKILPNNIFNKMT